MFAISCSRFFVLFRSFSSESIYSWRLVFRSRRHPTFSLMMLRYIAFSDSLDSWTRSSSSKKINWLLWINLFWAVFRLYLVTVIRLGSSIPRFPQLLGLGLSALFSLECLRLCFPVSPGFSMILSVNKIG